LQKNKKAQQKQLRVYTSGYLDTKTTTNKKLHLKIFGIVSFID